MYFDVFSLLVSYHTANLKMETLFQFTETEKKNKCDSLSRLLSHSNVPLPKINQNMFLKDFKLVHLKYMFKVFNWYLKWS